MKTATKKGQRDIIRSIIAARQAQINNIELYVLKPIREGNERLKRVMKGEIPVEHEIKRQEELSIFIEKIFTYSKK